MKVLIVYATRNGASREAAEMLAERIGSRAEVSLYNIEDCPPSPDGFDVAVVGGSIRMGKLNKKLKAYIKDNLDKLSSMPSSAFICCGFSKSFEDYKIMQLPKQLHCSLGIQHFGGELKPDKLKGLDKLMVKMMREKIKTQDPDISDVDREELPELLPDTVYALAERICMLK